MRVLHVVKTSEGGLWAAREAAALVKLGVEVHAAVPSQWGAAMTEWRRSGARIHVCPLDLPVREPWQLAARSRAARRLVEAVKPDLIHSHFVGTTLLLRLALGKNHEIPRIFQVPGPLHLEHRPFRALDLATAGPMDFWIGTSKFIVEAYLRAGVRANRVFLSYHGGSASNIPDTRSSTFRRTLGIADHELVVGNANYMYPPKRYLGQNTGVKCHEQVIDALKIVIQRRPAVVGVLIGGVFGKSSRYEQKLRERARAAGGRILMPGYMRTSEIAACWADFDCAVHVPLSENCGGVLEPLLASVPTVAASVGGIPELVKDGETGKLVSGSDPVEVANAILLVLDRLSEFRDMAVKGRVLAQAMFDVQRTAAEVLGIYRHALHPHIPRPQEFNPATVLERISAGVRVDRERTA